jgi:hypothetical protein
MYANKLPTKMSEPCPNYKSTLVDTVITVEGLPFAIDKCGFTEEASTTTPIQVSIKAYELNYGPVIDYTIKCSVPFTDLMHWSDHPFMFSNKERSGKKTRSTNIIDDTPAVRAILQELAAKEAFQLYTTTDCTHRARLIQSLENFWS